MLDKLKNEFHRVFGGGSEPSVFFAPGRVNLIGEYTDLNGGHVFPCALTIGTYAVIRKRHDRKLCCYSMNFSSDGIKESSIDELEYREEDGWSNYVKGVVWAFSQKGYKIPYGMDFLCMGTIPNQSGLSSSASLEVLVSKILIDLHNLPVDMTEAALLSQYAENKFVGVNCGIMDQFAVANGKKGHAIFLDTNTLAYSYVPVELKGYKIVIGNTRKKRGLHDSKYNERRAECEQALADIRAIRPELKALCELTVEEFDLIGGYIKDEVCFRRARHAVYENHRTLKAVEALKQHDIITFGQLLNDSHRSLKEDFEVTGIELDTMAEAAREQNGVIGARMTGAGFGGCTVAVVREEEVTDFIKKVGDLYEQKIGYPGEFYVVDIGGGPGCL